MVPSSQKNMIKRPDGDAMPQVNCPECKNMVKVGSTECPACGAIFEKYQEAVLSQRKEVEEYYEQERKKQQKEKEQGQKRKKIEDLQIETLLREKEKRLKNCSSCDHKISKLATFCPNCGEPKQGLGSPEVEKRLNQMSIFTDFQFRNFATPNLIKAIYALVCISGLICGVAIIIASFFTLSPALIVIRTTGVIFGLLLILLVSRIICECILILFKIEDNTKR